MTEELRNLEAALGVMRDGLGIGEFEVERFLPESDQLFDLLVRIRLKFENIYSQAKVVREFHQLLTGFVDPDKNKFRCGVFRVSPPTAREPAVALLSFRFARDSPLEGDGFEPSVPRQRVTVGDGIR